ncbi:epoxide hydrolase [Artemisia annua]|uniref:Epoxide hydrolase n=1 Tax=Artemisia annua TaxID=35608 RepID=A0A2U1KIR2_ARTAN|nr:epoxide hydrolase [Artemisia annua]
MDQISHRFVQVNGLKLHVAEIGQESSPAVIFLHGFPEIWYTWRHQMIAVANAGFRAIAPDFRGYGLSESPAEPEKASFADLITDTASILDALAISKRHLPLYTYEILGFTEKDLAEYAAYCTKVWIPIYASQFPQGVTGMLDQKVQEPKVEAKTFADHWRKITCENSLECEYVQDLAHDGE